MRIDLRRQVADGGSWRTGGSSSSVYRVYYCFCEADGAVLVEEFVLSTAFVRLMEQYYLQESYLVLLSRSWKSSTNPVYRGYYCFYEADGAVVPAEIVLSTAPVQLEEQY